ncbi:MAG: KH domain-containing protein [Candidatus Anstonellales archaeon]
MIVVPGEKISDRRIESDYIYEEGGKSYAAVLGMLEEDGKFIPLEGAYMPLRGDTVIGIVVNSRHAGYTVDINLPYPGFIVARDLRNMRLKLGDVILASIRDVEEEGTIMLAEPKLLPKGKVIDFPTVKIPRLLGKGMSMLKQIKEETKTNIIVANNGYVWISETGNIPLVLQVLNLVKQRAHKKGLTDYVLQFIRSKVRQ